MLRIEAIEIDDLILDKIERKHGVAFEEAEEVCRSENRHVRKGRDGLYKVFGQTEGGRYLFVVLAHAQGGVWRLVTARDMTAVERQLHRHERGD